MIKQKGDTVERLHFMLSDYAPWQLYRWTYNKDVNVIERFDVKKEEWVTHDNDLLRAAFVDQADAALTAIPAVKSIKQAVKLSTEGHSAVKGNLTTDF